MPPAEITYPTQCEIEQKTLLRSKILRKLIQSYDPIRLICVVVYVRQKFRKWVELFNVTIDRCRYC